MMEPNERRTDQGDRWIKASKESVYQAMVDRHGLERWLPPSDMVGRMERFDPRPGGGYRMVLTYRGRGKGKATEGSDIVEAEFTDLVPGERVVQRVEFVADDPSFSGRMTMSWLLDAEHGGTRVTIRAENVPPGISRTDHEAGLASSLANLAAYVEADGAE
ncbi:SRPBCC family protein [Nocardiopsis baichengensis]|uniref:SRPBCC family protein n=1 Tax=Nocardiopsis baichengensis TaxID=280240 RepID=UPI00034B0792|nr:SRPBCC family protein [Nocardiopsis baichengensis]